MGVTVEATTTVSLKCNQDEDSIYDAEDEASRMAEDMSANGADEMYKYIEEFMEIVDAEN
jgi:hypothetical protein